VQPLGSAESQPEALLRASQYAAPDVLPVWLVKANRVNDLVPTERA
jgi:hypothetical protein